MAISYIRKGTTKLNLIIDLQTDLSSSTARTLLVTKQDSSTILEWTADIYQTNKLKYITAAGDLDDLGWYKIIAKVTFPNEKICYSKEIVEFLVIDTHKSDPKEM